MATFPITVDATALSNAGYLIIGPPTGFNVFPTTTGTDIGWTDNTKAYTVEMVPGDFLFQIESGGVDSFHFQVTAEGTISYAAEYAPFLSGAGTTELRVLGYKIQLDARYISGELVWSSNLLFKPTAIVLDTFNLIPLGGYILSLPGEASDMTWGFGIDGSGKVNYVNEYDYSEGGFLQGQGTSTLTLLGYPLLIDARNAGGAGVRLVPGQGVPFAVSGVTYANLLPETVYVLEFEDGVPSAATFGLSTTGAITINHQLPWVLSLDEFHGVRRLTVNRITLERTTIVTEKPVLHA